MANKQNDSKSTASNIVQSSTQTKKATASTYTVEEFASAPKSLGVESQDIIRAAFKVAGKDSATVEEAKKLVDDFKKRKVN